MTDKLAAKIIDAIVDQITVDTVIDGLIVKGGWENELPNITLIAKDAATLDRSDLRDVAYDAVTSWLSESTNNDACDVEIRETASFDDDENFVLTVRAKVLDYMS
jgi:hypothetical protein